MQALTIGTHVLGGGVWIGAMIFSVFVLHPRAERYFQRATDFEDFIFHVVHGARWKVLGGIAAIAGSGGALALARSGAPSPYPLLLAAKAALFLVSLGLFVYVSWVLWPRRVFAREDELAAVRRRFWWVGVAMITSNALNMALGIASRVLRAP